MHVFVLEDHEELRREVLLPALRAHGFRVQGAATAAEFYRLMLAQRFDIVVLDIGLPDEDGLAVAKHLRSVSDIGIVILTGHEGRHHHLRALQSGADFYLVKPVDLDLLAATVQNLARRLPARQVRDAAPIPMQPLRWRLEAGGWRLVSPRGKVVALTAMEQCIAATLAAAHGQPVSRDALICALSQNACDFFDPHRLEMTIHRLRRKALSIANEILPLVTVRGSGYMLACDSDSSMTLSS
ncbi:response regulator transcription factor [Dyella jejuensis]|uniref:Response regulator transcription factor n=1 Tax=Dyella jejuensis TaxID=1432009 RepID=A0ABW8JKK7_9GAMM